MAAFQRYWVTPGAAVFTKQGPKVALLMTLFSPPQNKEPPLRGGFHLRTVAIVEPAKGKRGTSAGWHLVSAADVGDDGSEKPRLHAVGKVPTVAAMGSRAPKGTATKHTEQSAHQAAIWVALEYAGQCLSKGSKVTLTVESATALRNLHDAPADEEARPGAAALGGVAAQTPHRDGAARPMPGNGNKSDSASTRDPTSRGGGRRRREL